MLWTFEETLVTPPFQPEVLSLVGNCRRQGEQVLLDMGNFFFLQTLLVVHPVVLGKGVRWRPGTLNDALVLSDRAPAVMGSFQDHVSLSRIPLQRRRKHLCGTCYVPGPGAMRMKRIIVGVGTEGMRAGGGTKELM